MNATRLALLACLLLAGCGHHSTKPVVQNDGLPPSVPVADTPQHLAMRFEATFDLQAKSPYGLLLTDNFRFHFSAASDPDLVATYGDDWTRTMEIQAVQSVFGGRYPDLPGAGTVAMTLGGIAIGPDPEHPDSTDHYAQMVIGTMEVDMEFPTTPDPTVYHMTGRQELRLVRGDAAVLATSSQPATADRWYVRRWDDLTGGTPLKGAVIHPAAAYSIGRNKARYL